MLNDLKDTVRRSQGTLMQDAAGILSLVAMLIVSLNLTDLI